MKYRTVWLSDIHLGSKGCQADKLLAFLKQVECEYLFLVGDIIDIWAMKRQFYWPETHNTIIQKFLRKARHGTKVIYIPGNHDEMFRQYIIDHPISFGDIEIHQEYLHTLANGKTVLCIHGDYYDVVMKYHKWLAFVGDIGYSILLWLNRHFNYLRKLLRMRYWSISQYIKYKVKSAVSFIGHFEQNVISECKDRGVDCILCGHIHHAEMKQYGDILYLNTGDTVESCTAIVETYNNELVLLGFGKDEIEIIAGHKFNDH
ncbi:MAG TPA: UDP-2,3-diacylglucosamine diphosphatase [Candidatus Bathyarchaeia archaeon]|nr:UDP-2,3-diacylglucosamine diphosphatase [Candidatus Bathyarchaeia archaeon]